MANVAFESEEAPEVPNPTIKLENDANETSIEETNHTQAQQFYILPALFFIHGVGGSANIWSNQLSYFANLGHEVIAPDLLGKLVFKDNFFFRSNVFKKFDMNIFDNCLVCVYN